jgi:hypothetical protein
MVNTDRPTARARPHPQPGRLNTRERLRTAATTRRLEALESDWLFQGVSAYGRTRLLVEHGLLPKAALGATPR